MVPCDSNAQAINTLTATSDLVRRDHFIPGLGLLLDPERLLGGLRGELDVARVDEIKLVYIRYKPGMNCLARYQLRVDGHDVSAYAKAHGKDGDDKLAKSIQRTVTDSTLGPGRVVLPDQQVIFSTFPNDAKLVSLHHLGDPGNRRRLFRRLFGRDSAWQDSELDKTLNYKPERRYVAKVTRTDGEPALVKFYSHSGYAKARSISRKLGKAGNGFYPESLGRSKKYALVAYRWQAGTTLRQLQIDGKLSLSNLAAMAGSLAAFHNSGFDGLLPLAAGEQAKRLGALAEQVSFLLPHLATTAGHVATGLSEWLAGQAPVLRTVHGDFYDKQAIVCDGRVRLIDLDAARLDNPLLDLGSYLAHLERQVINQTLSPEDVEVYKKTLIDAYEQAAGPVHIKSLGRYTALGLFDLIHQPFRDWARDWPTQTGQLLDRTRQLLSA